MIKKSIEPLQPCAAVAEPQNSATLELKYAEIKAKFGMTDADFALLFGFKSKAAFANSSAFERYKSAVERLFLLFYDCR